MAILKNERHERFAQALAAGKTADEAYAEAGYKPNRGNASRMKADENIARRVAELLERAGDRVEISVARVLKELGVVAFSDMGKFAEWGPDGVSLIDKANLTDDERRAVLEVSESVSESSTQTGGSQSHSRKIKLHDKLKALELIGRHLKMFTDKVEHTGKDDGPIEITDARERLADVLARSSRRTPGASEA